MLGSLFLLLGTLVLTIMVAKTRSINSYQVIKFSLCLLFSRYSTLIPGPSRRTARLRRRLWDHFMVSVGCVWSAFSKCNAICYKVLCRALFSSFSGHIWQFTPLILMNSNRQLLYFSTIKMIPIYIRNEFGYIRMVIISKSEAKSIQKFAQCH
jgi:hypothetical protein